MKKSKNKKVVMALAVGYIIFSILSFFGEALVAHIRYDYSLFLRITALLLDIIFILTGVLTLLQVYLRNKLRKQRIFQKRNRLIIYLSDTMSLMILFFALYIVRLVFLYYLGKIPIISVYIGGSTALGIVILFGAVFNNALRRLKMRFKKVFSKKNPPE